MEKTKPLYNLGLKLSFYKRNQNFIMNLKHQ